MISNNPAPTNIPVLEVIKNRWSPLSFSSDALSPEEMKTLFEAMRWAPSSFNEQPWRVLYAHHGDEHFGTFSSLLVEGNSWAKDAAVLLVICSQKRFKRNDKENKHALYDTGAAIENLFLQATSMGLYAHEMAGFDVEKAREELSIPDQIEVVAMMAIGKPGKSGELTEDLRQRENSERQRKAQSELVANGAWVEKLT